MNDMGTDVQMSLKVYVYQGSYRQDCEKFKDFSRTSKDFPSVFKD